jgi:hypothetical protein
MAGYSNTVLWEKLGYKTGLCAHLDGAPGNYLALLKLPSEVAVTWLELPRIRMDFVHCFVRSQTQLKKKLQSYRKKISPAGVIWISWPKKSSGVTTDIAEDTIRDVALPMGLVDIKVCAVDEVWSGLKLMIRKELR